MGERYRPLNCGYGKTASGLQNVANTCFINAVLQCLTHTVPFVEKLSSSVDHFNSCTRGDDDFCFFCALAHFIYASLKWSGEALVPSDFVNNLSKIVSYFQLGQQEDAQEFLHGLLNKVHEQYFLNSDSQNHRPSLEDDSLITQIFVGRLKSQLRCCECGYISTKMEPVMDLSLEIGNAPTLTDALKSYTNIEKIDEFSCEGCKAKVSMEKQLKLDQVPQVVVLHLKRFKIESDHVEKIQDFVEYPLELDLRPFLSSPQDELLYRYELCTILVHRGAAYQGHYYSIVHPSPNEWYGMNDLEVIKVSEDAALHQKAYILFYIKEGSSPWFSTYLNSSMGRVNPLRHRPNRSTDSEVASEERNEQMFEKDDPPITANEVDHNMPIPMPHNSRELLNQWMTSGTNSKVASEERNDQVSEKANPPISMTNRVDGHDLSDHEKNSEDNDKAKSEQTAESMIMQRVEDATKKDPRESEMEKESVEDATKKDPQEIMVENKSFKYATMKDSQEINPFSSLGFRPRSLVMRSLPPVRNKRRDLWDNKGPYPKNARIKTEPQDVRLSKEIHHHFFDF